MFNSLTSALKISVLLCAIFALQVNLADETTEEGNDPCEDLLIVISPDDEGDVENTSKSLDLSIEKLDECLDALLYGDSGGSSTVAGTNGLQETHNSGETNATGPQNSSTLASSLAELDQHLANQEIELAPIEQQSNSNSTSEEGKDSTGNRSQLLSHLDQEERSVDTKVSPGDSSDNSGRSELQGGDPTQDSKHAEPNRQPADPEDEDELLRQLREAAEKESNPRTKQALWDQYYEYLDNREKG